MAPPCRPAKATRHRGLVRLQRDRLAMFSCADCSFHCCVQARRKGVLDFVTPHHDHGAMTSRCTHGRRDVQCSEMMLSRSFSDGSTQSQDTE
jgi:hypothetical protein